MRFARTAAAACASGAADCRCWPGNQRIQLWCCRTCHTYHRVMVLSSRQAGGAGGESVLAFVCKAAAALCSGNPHLWAATLWLGYCNVYKRISWWVWWWALLLAAALLGLLLAAAPAFVLIRYRTRCWLMRIRLYVCKFNDAVSSNGAMSASFFVVWWFGRGRRGGRCSGHSPPAARLTKALTPPPPTPPHRRAPAAIVRCKQPSSVTQPLCEYWSHRPKQRYQRSTIY